MAQAFTESGPGMLYVNSRVSNPALTDDIFNKWYDEIHVPDVLASKGIKSASRYKTCETGQVERPYLALYPTDDVQFLGSKDFLAIPNESDILPNKGSIFQEVDFDVKYVKHVKTIGKGQAGSANFAVTVVFEMKEGKEEATKLLESRNLPTRESTFRASLWRSLFSGANVTDAKEMSTPLFVVILEFEEQVETSAIKSGFPKSTVTQFKLRQAFGEKVTYFS